jgi:hypothetical protein
MIARRICASKIAAETKLATARTFDCLPAPGHRRRPFEACEQSLMLIGGGMQPVEDRGMSALGGATTG